MADQGYRKLTEMGRITLPKEFRDEHGLEKGDKILWKKHSRDNSKLIIKVPKKSQE